MFAAFVYTISFSFFLSLSLSLYSRARTHGYTHSRFSHPIQRRLHARTHAHTQSALKPDQHTYMLLLNLIAVIAKEDKAAQPGAAKEVLNVLSQVSLI